MLPAAYFHVVYTLPSQLRDVAYQNKRVVYDLLMKAAAETTLEIAADRKRLGARIGITAVLHTWGSAMTHHPHVHMIVPGGGLSEDGTRWIASRENFLVHVHVLAEQVPGQVPCHAGAAHADGKRNSSTPTPVSPIRKPSSGSSGRCAVSNGESIGSRHSPVPSRFCAISPDTRTASPSQTDGSLPPTMAESPSAIRTIASKDPDVGRR